MIQNMQKFTYFNVKFKEFSWAATFGRDCCDCSQTRPSTLILKSPASPLLAVHGQTGTRRAYFDEYVEIEHNQE